MKKSAFLLIPLWVAAEAAGALEFRATNTLCGSSKDSMNFDVNTTFEQSDNGFTPRVEKKAKDLIRKDPEQAKMLRTKAKIVTGLVQEARKLNDAETAKVGEQLARHLETVADFQEGKTVPDQELNEAHDDYKFAEQKIAQLKLRVSVAKHNTPQARKIREFTRAARNYRDKAGTAAKLRQHAEAEYYMTCAQINRKLALEYAKDPGIETAAKEQLKNARRKYLEDSARESAVRFRKRAENMRKANNTAKAEYYDKVVILKEKMAEAYAKSDYAAARTLQKEYRQLQSTQDR
ncbi:MAG: hypothetical protein PHH77_06190 [Victivallaceae bacterium]|nr:hypothetical protein [Victivallaceae bacterium]